MLLIVNGIDASIVILSPILMITIYTWFNTHSYVQWLNTKAKTVTLWHAILEMIIWINNYHTPVTVSIQLFIGFTVALGWL